MRAVTGALRLASVDAAVQEVKRLLPDLRRLMDAYHEAYEEFSEQSNDTAAVSQRVRDREGVDTYAELSDAGKEEVDASVAKDNAARERISSLEDEMAELDDEATEVLEDEGLYERGYHGGVLLSHCTLGYSAQCNWKRLNNYLDTLDLRAEASRMRDQVDRLREEDVSALDVGDHFITTTRNPKLYRVLKITPSGRFITVEDSVSGDKERLVARKVGDVKKMPERLAEEVVEVQREYEQRTR